MRSARLVRAAVALTVAVALGRLGNLPAGSPPLQLPEVASPPPALATALREALAAKGSGYEPRTRHRNPDGTPKYTNRLILEDSPYLLQHAHNPVDWYPWGEEAFARARREHRPILLSVGYSTCHWCHVMEEESFDDEEVAAELNRHYVAIKVDRERRPDVDAIYMAAVQMMAGNGGWPMTVWLTPDREPFYGGTYFPARDGDRGVRFGFLTLLRRVYEIYAENPDRAAAAAADLAGRVRQQMASASGDRVPGPDVLRRAVAELAPTFDAAHGGFGGAPRFPRPLELQFLLRYHRRADDPASLRMVVRTLEAMAAGGIYDHVGGGFHRYATDVRWRVPHFEKMLYDNALLTLAYLEAYQVTGREEFGRVVRETLAYVARDLSAPEGGFYSASDADSEGVEGKFFTWTADQVRAALPAEQATLALAYYDVHRDGANILHVPRPLAAVAAELSIDPASAPRMLQDARSALDIARRRRVPPHTDQKVLTAWNGLMLSAFARAGQVLADGALVDRATRAADFLLVHLRRGDRLVRSSLDGRASGDAYLEDYAFVMAGLLDLYEASFDPRWLRESLALQAVLDRHYWDDAGGGYFRTADDGERLLAREKPSTDGAEPSGNSIALLNLLRLAEFTTDDRLRARAEAGLRAFEPTIIAAPSSVAGMLAAVDFASDTPKEIVIVTPDGASGAQALLAILHRSFVPNRILAVVDEQATHGELTRTVPLVEGKLALRRQATAYVCERRVCDLPTTDPAVFAHQLARVVPLPEDSGSTRPGDPP